jgi:D-sedoheptulose 7-phosphate isomerase
VIVNNIDRFFVEDAEEFSRRYLAYVTKVFHAIDVKQIAAFVDTLLRARERGAAIYFVGNGGSASTAAHFANDLSIGTRATRRPFRAISLCDNHAVVTAIANDFGYDQIFVRQLEVLAKPGDVVVGLSASGNSPNLIKAFEYARANGVWTVALTSFDGGKLKQIADQGVHVPTDPQEYGPAEDAHMMLDHLLGSYLVRLVRSEQ